MANKIYPGVSAFFANRVGNHNWIENVKRPFISLISTSKKGKRSYDDLFISSDPRISVSIDKDNMVHITFPADISKPLFSVLNK